MNDPVSRIALFGHRRELWPLAALIGRSVPGHIEFVAVEDVAERPPSAVSVVCEGDFNRALGLGPADYAAAGATLGLGHEFRGWRGEGTCFFSAPSGPLPDVEGVAIHHALLRAARSRGTPERLAEFYRPFRLCARAAEAGKFALGSPDPMSPLTLLRPTVQCDADSHAQLFEQLADRALAHHLSGVPAEVTQDGEEIRSVRLEDGRDVVADFFIDASGGLHGFVSGPPKPADHAASFAFDRRIAVRRSEPPGHRHTRITALPGGVLIETPLAEGSLAELIFCSAHMDEAAASDRLGIVADGAPLDCFALDTPWTGNLARLGAGSARLGPYLSVDTRLLQAQAIDLAALLPVTKQMTVEASEFNRRHNQSAAQLQDFIAASLRLNGRSDRFWVERRKAEISPALETRLDQFASRGRLVTFDREMVDEQTWIEMLIGSGIVPGRYDRRTDSLDMTIVAARLRTFTGHLDRAIASMPAHADFMRRLARDPGGRR